MTNHGSQCYHHTHHIKEGEIHPNNIKELLRELRANEKAVSSYEPNVYETFAEAMKLFILNPNLLKNGRPKRWEFLTRDMKLVPLHDAPWKEVLVYAHEKIIAAAEKWAHT